MIKLFVTDLDGCISHPFKTPHWESINRLRELNQKSAEDSEIPPLTICTGRPFPYAEAVGQWLDIRYPFVFESAGLYHWEGNRIQTALDETGESLDPIYAVKAWLTDEILPEYPNAILEFTKMMDAGIVCPDESVINKIHERALKYIPENFEGLEIHTTEISINILMPGNNKLRGLQLLGEHLNISLDQMAYIGDTGGDAVALKEVKMPFAPSNARKVAKDVAKVTVGETTQGVLEAYEEVIEYNRSVG
ncbi:HAD family phosphatase [Rhodohalobacter sp. SW132]|uniref:HAD family hydrolase n=1 Tax=Rhodohalobacter sp. SW132 TaxID=2293433 RepID=UPI000E26F4C4|nr:HAD family hydrolase [Rhodohalobacter sp. SW132]REL37666.1 HAD family phosphatase [Rhodohalobacter sp. SW132]